jgi:hypothetical protein
MACSWDPYEKYKLAGEAGSLLTDIEQTLNQLMRQAAKGRYVKLSIATPMCRCKLCAVITIDVRLALASSRKHLYIVSAPEGAPLAHHLVGNRLFSIFWLLDSCQIYSFSESS